MQCENTKLEGVKILTPRAFHDERGFFLESFNQREFNRLMGRETVFVQDNHSRSTQGVLRGLHFQSAPRAQAKLVRVARGDIFTVVVDLRPDSKSFLQWQGFELSDKNLRQLWIPEGFAHGFYVLSAIADCQYKTTEYYAPEAEGSLLWNDPELRIEWPLLDDPVISERDVDAMTLADFLENRPKRS